MKRLSMNELTTYRWSFEDDVQHYHEAGITAISVWRDKIADFGEERGVELLGELGLEVAALQWAGGFTGSEGRSYKESVQDAREALRLAAALRTNCLIVYSGARSGHTHGHARRLLRGALRELLPIAEEFGINLAIEPMHPGCASEWTFLNNLDETLELLDAMASPRIQLAFDTYHWGHDPDVLNRIHDLASRTAIVQLGDAKSPPNGEQNRCRLGTGKLPLSNLVSAFCSAGYDGYFDIELMGEEIEAEDYQELIMHSIRAYQDFPVPAKA
jgi:sugar phosphate isomerase/epimerase